MRRASSLRSVLKTNFKSVTNLLLESVREEKRRVIKIKLIILIIIIIKIITILFNKIFNPWVANLYMGSFIKKPTRKEFKKRLPMRLIRPGPTAAITRTITIMTQRERVLLVELLHAQCAHAHSTNSMCSLCVVIVIILVIAAMGPGLYRVVGIVFSHRAGLCCVVLLLLFIYLQEKF